MLLNINRSRLYYTPKETAGTDLDMIKEILEIYVKHPATGSRHMRQMLVDKGYPCNRKKIRRLMQENGMRAVYPKRKTTIINKQHKKWKYLLRNLKIVRPNQVWAIDITYIKLRKGYVYLIGIIDIFSRKIVGWRLSPFLDKEPCLASFEEALIAAVPEIANSDQGCQFTSEAWSAFLLSCGISISMDGKGRWADNIFIERFWRTIKYECIFLNSLETLEQARRVIEEYIVFYNTERPHQSLNYKTPEVIYTNEQAQANHIKFLQAKEARLRAKKEAANMCKNAAVTSTQSVDIVVKPTTQEHGSFMGI
jgi:putative transposase